MQLCNLLYKTEYKATSYFYNEKRQGKEPPLSTTSNISLILAVANNKVRTVLLQILN
jgi:hypothetical protein